jgi:hypothetical protein
MKSKNQKLLKDFTKYCLAHPDERFHQALLNWMEGCVLLFRRHIIDELEDTYYFQEKNK